MTPADREKAARERAHDLICRIGGQADGVGTWCGYPHIGRHSSGCDLLTEVLLAEDTKLDAEKALFEVLRKASVELIRERNGARAAALREAEEIARRRGHAYTRTTVLTAHNVVEVAARAACLGVADEIAAFHATPPTSAATTGRETP